MSGALTWILRLSATKATTVNPDKKQKTANPKVNSLKNRIYIITV